MLIVLPYFFSVPLAVLPAGAADWLLRVTPAAGFAIQQYVPAYPQVNNVYTPQHGYFPLAPWAGLRRAVRLGRGRPLPGHRPAPPEGRMSEALHAEWTKLRTLPGTGWLLLGVVAVTVIVSATVSAAVSCSSAAACHVDVTKLSLTGTYLGQAVVAILAVLAVGGEYGTGMIRDHADRDAAPDHGAGRQGRRGDRGRRWPPAPPRCSARCWPGG